MKERNRERRRDPGVCSVSQRGSPLLLAPSAPPAQTSQAEGQPKVKLIYRERRSCVQHSGQAKEPSHVPLLLDSYLCEISLSPL